MTRIWLLLFFISLSNTAWAVEPITPYEKEIQNASKRYGVKSAFIKAIVKQESRFKANAVSTAGAVGLMQLMKPTAEDLGLKTERPDERYNPQKNVYAGTKYINQMLRAFGGNPCLALAAYNYGPGNMRKMIRKYNTNDCNALYPNLPGETKTYIANITQYAKEYGIDLKINIDPNSLPTAVNSSFSTGTNSIVPIPKIFKPMFDRANSEVDKFKKNMFNSISPKIKLALNSILTLWVIFYAYKLYRGEKRINDSFEDFLKLVLILSLITNYSNFDNMIGANLSSAANYFVSVSQGGSVDVGESLDNITGIMTINFAHIEQVTTSDINGLLITIMSFLFNLMTTAFSNVYMMSIIGLGICYFFAPLALILFIFESTKEFTVKWFQLSLFFVLVQILVTIILYIVFAMGLNSLNNLSYFELTDYIYPIVFLGVALAMFIDASRLAIALVGGQDLIFPGILGKKLIINSAKKIRRPFRKRG